MSQGKNILVVEDEVDLADLICFHLEKEGFTCRRQYDGNGALAEVQRDPPDLVLLDLHLPGGEDGFALARFLRERSRKVGIIMLTASGDTIDQVVGLETGADDYVSKPYQGRALLARIKAVLRRTGATEAMAIGPRVRIGKCLLDLQSRRLTTLAGEEISLRSGEFELLKLFAENPNRPLSRDWLLETTSHREMEAFDRAIDIRVLRIRRKIELDPSRPTSIRTVRNAGYMFVPPED